MRVVIVNDTSQEEHAGCKLVGKTLDEQFALRDIEVIGTLPVREILKDWRQFRPLLDKADLVVVNGEGSIHHGRKQHLLEIPLEYPSALINIVFEGVKEPSGLSHFLYVSARESLSAEHVRSHGVDCEIVPDLILMQELERIHKGGLGTGTVDAARYLYTNTDLGIHETDFIEKVSRYDNIVCGRFHGILICLLLGIPFSAYPSNTYKNEGLMIDLGLSPYYKKDIHQAAEVVPDSIRENDYIQTGRDKIKAMFNTLAAL